MTTTVLNDLTPTSLWQHFAMLCETPRPSWHEAAVMTRITEWADRHGLAYTQDEAGNLLIKKPATPGHDNAPTVALQAHVDMVAEVEAYAAHDFTRDAIWPRVVDGWLMATDTTLGADNGIGVAAALAALEEPGLTHGPLEVLLTVAEEVSLVGAARLAPGWLSADYLLNLDTEEAGDVCIGCAGGTNVALDEAMAMAPLAPHESILTIEIGGLAGGHSGMDIHTGRASANRLMARLLAGLAEEQALRLMAIEGGRMDNAITRRAVVQLAVAHERIEAARQTAQQLGDALRAELIDEDQGLTVNARADAPGPGANTAVTAEASAAIIELLAGLPYGVDAMSAEAPGTVETSNNIGILNLEHGRLTAQLMVRSLVDQQRDRLAERIAGQMREAGFAPTRSAGYPGWAPDAGSALLARFKRVHEATIGQAPRVVVLHAGLECGLIGAKYPQMEMISFGPTIRGAHSPAERVEIESVAPFYTLLQNTLADLAAVKPAQGVSS